MTTAIKNRIQMYWDEGAESYDQEYGHGLRSEREKALWLDLLRRNVNQDGELNILDAGCGTGFLSILLAELGHTVTGIDLSETMRVQAAAKAARADLALTLLSGDAEAPPFGEQNFDAVISRHLLWTLPAPDRALANWRRLLRPGGSVLVIDGVWTPRSPTGRLRFLVADGIRLLRGSLRHMRWKKKYVASSHLPLFGGGEPEAVMELMDQAGFRDLWIDRMEPILDHERRNGPLEYRITHGRNRRYLIGGKV